MKSFPITPGPGWGGGGKNQGIRDIWGREKRGKKINNELSVSLGISPKYVEIKFYFLNESVHFYG